MSKEEMEEITRRISLLSPDYWVSRGPSIMSLDTNKVELKALGHPEAKGRKPKPGEEQEQWTITIPLENEEVLVLKLGKKDRDLIFGMLVADCVEHNEEEPK